MTAFRRLITLTLALVCAGALAGAACGVLALVPAWIANRLHPTPDDTFIVWSELAVWAATAGGVLGALLGPTLAISLLRHCPLWRVVCEPVIGTVVGSVIGWTLANYGFVPGIPALAVSGLVGALCAALRLRWAAQRRERVAFEAAT
jgi:NhaP-type Na+/H+ or K+/H+ antiporter